MKKSIQQAMRPNAKGHPMLSEVDAERISIKEGKQLGEIYKATLALETWPERYVRNAGSFSCAEQRALLGKKVCVAGCGGLGGYIAQLLARMGVGHLLLFDPDTYEASNLNRQVFASSKTLGRAKAETTMQAIQVINTSTSVMAYKLDVTGKEAQTHLAGVDLIADGLDTLQDRARLSNLSRELGVPMVHAALSGFEARVMVLWPDGPSFGELFGAEAETTAEETLGTPAVTPAVAAGLQCTQIVRVLTGRLRFGNSVMVHMDLAEMSTESYFF
ncbi:HesA/MoeB/ThiF family protein [Desulfoluna sp.]|uniref:HesA/MoeB/ThiF family protein n=1 Tax=Desulfoluna sp. TaxID=2045199 RepID=UPI002626F9A9|nr:HesA/MoeB/ThiF family protein [Desulfoluna sp.]